VRTNFINQYFIGHGIVLNRIVLYYGSGEKIRHTFGHTVLDTAPIVLFHHYSKLLRFLVIKPLPLLTHADGADVAGMARKLRAIWLII
jgi:hypothetical protein